MSLYFMPGGESLRRQHSAQDHSSAHAICAVPGMFEEVTNYDAANVAISALIPAARQSVVSARQRCTPER